MRPTVQLLDLGEIDYGECWERQRELFDRLAAGKAAEAAAGAGSAAGKATDAGSAGSMAEKLAKTGAGNTAEAGYLILCEHPHVYTLGKSGHRENLLVSEDFLRGIGAGFYRIDRGGDITYHGPGQIVGYPILDLEKIGIGLRGYIAAVEQSVIETVGQMGIPAGRSEGKTGVWIKDGRNERKICAIGVRSSRFITMHGFALNAATDLKYFDHINPCGFVSGGVTSIEAELGRKVPAESVKRILCDRLAENLKINYEL